MSVLDIAMAVTDTVTAAIPRQMPAPEKLQRCRIISHRGEHDNRDVRENTLTAFRNAHAAGVWGIECDVRWTADLVPVICHDESPLRVFGLATPISNITFAQLRAAVPEIPSLAEIVQEFGKKAHLMLELKHEDWPDQPQQQDILQDTLSTLMPAQDYHLLALDAQTYQLAEFAPNHCYLPVAELNVKTMSDFALKHDCAGFSGHYLLLGNRYKEQHANAGQRLAVGFPRSANALKRELNRGVDWIFSNHAVKLQGLLDQYISAHTTDVDSHHGRQDGH